MRTTISFSTCFGREGDAASHQLYGWSIPEDGFTWIDGKSSALTLPRHDAPHGLVVELSGWPHRAQDRLLGQHIILKLNGREIGDGFVRERMRHAWYIPPFARHDGFVLQIETPDACDPGVSHDDRILGYAATGLRIMPLVEPVQQRPRRIAALPVPENDGDAVRLAKRLTGLELRDLALQVESLGSNCELGFFQRMCEAEPLGLLRFSGASIDALVAGLDDGFAELGDADAIDPVPEETTLHDWVVYERRYLLRYHTWVPVHGATAAEMKRRESKRLIFLRRKFLSDVAEGTKLFVHQSGRNIPMCEILPLFVALRRIGASATLLWICPADTDHPPGFVEEVQPGLLRAFLGQFSRPLAGELSLSNWVVCIANALLLKGIG